MNFINPFEVVQDQLDEVMQILKIDSNVMQILRTPMREIHVSIPVRMDNGDLKVFHGFRVQYNNALGPCKGGIRFHPEETIDTIRALAAWMTWKTACIGLPLGGAKGGVICNPKEMSVNELERLARGYIDKIWQLIGPDQDIPAPDVYTNPQIMAWMMDEYSKIIGKNQFGVITGKPIKMGGSLGREDATARGGMSVLREAAKYLGLDLAKSTIAIQGFGNAGYYTAVLAKKMFGMKVIAVSDSNGGVFNSNGIDIKALKEYKEKTGHVSGFSGAKDITNEELLLLDVDVLAPSAIEEVITKNNANDIKAKIVLELANGPTTPDADKILFKKGVHLVPDFLANAGGVTVSYFEMVQNFYMYYWDEDLVYKRLDHRMTEAYRNVLKAAKEHNISMRQAAYLVAIKRIFEVMKLRGWW
ncbi:glutamate dehydrogenase (NAD/NADP) [Thermodesulfobium acidiphilum]|uniref:Glutamate dehydrogenase n=1 Tax=Thermodesulfobium acidiphilum TaxID=1794699 RepID=A0A2R4W0D5_THEAF|nr:Glu/Leu/Phe/Val dehydrogenase [Thermodesulfobium acidiphilum]AWB10186.1 glutamate dehydrogenase (NAD/NADP) [Thermodesulfobium acidiphilum]